MTYSFTNIGDDYMQSMMEPATQPAPTPHNRVSVQKLLIELCRSTFVALDNSEDRGGDEIHLQRSDVEALSAALDKLDELPDDQPGYVMGPAAKAEWFLLGKARPQYERVVCIGWETISKLATGEVVDVEDQKVRLIAADSLFGRDWTEELASALPGGRLRDQIIAIIRHAEHESCAVSAIRAADEILALTPSALTGKE